MRIDIWSDIICPWCYIGRERFSRALADFDGDVHVVHRAFQLDPRQPRRQTQPVSKMLAAKFGPNAAAMEDRVAGIARADGLPYRTDRLVGSTLDIHRVLHHARAQGKHGELFEAVLAAYFGEARNVFDAEVLAQLGDEVGLDADGVHAVFSDDDAYAEAVRADAIEGAQLGVRGVPFFVIDRRYGISGAQEVQVFAGALRQAAQAGETPAPR